MQSDRANLFAACAIGAMALAYAILSKDSYNQYLLTWVAINAVLAVAMRFVLLVGETNMALGAFYGFGAYSAAIAVTKFGLPFPLAIVLGGLVALVVSVAFGFMTLRTKGPYFMLISFSFTEIVRIIYTRVDYIGGNSGMTGIFPPRGLDPWYATVVVAIAICLIALLYAVERSNYGKLFKAIKLNDALVETVGLNVLHIKIVCLGVAALAIGTAGSLHAFTNNVISPGDFGYLVPVFALAYVKIGGDGNVWGPILGAALLTVVGQTLRGSGSFEQILFGGAIVVAMLVLPDGIVGGLRRVMRIIITVATPLARTQLGRGHS